MKDGYASTIPTDVDSSVWCRDERSRANRLWKVVSRWKIYSDKMMFIAQIRTFEFVNLYN